jgi:hypothetical protein
VRVSDPQEYSPQEKPRAGWSYSGEVWTDGAGRAVVVLPPFVRTHKAGFDYQLTPVGSPCSAAVAEEIADDRFTVATDQPHVKVAWRVTALREKGQASDGF